MINAEIQCDIVLKSFVPKVVPQLWMDPKKITTCNQLDLEALYEPLLQIMIMTKCSSKMIG